MRQVHFPVLDDGQPDAQGVVATWFVDDGANVREGQLLAEVQVEKISAEIHAPAAGVLRRAIGEGDLTPQGTVVAVVE